MPHTRNGRQAKQRRQQAAQDRKPKTAEERLLINIFGKKKDKTG